MSRKDHIQCPDCGESFYAGRLVENSDSVVYEGEYEIECPLCDAEIDLEVEVLLTFRVKPAPRSPS